MDIYLLKLYVIHISTYLYWCKNCYLNTIYISKNKWNDSYLRNSLTDKLYKLQTSV